MRILIVEDDALIAQSMKETVEREGHVVVRLAPDVDSALMAAAKLSFDLALVDYSLADGSCGADAVRLLRNRYWVPSIFVSGNPENCRKGWKETGALGCLPKPFREDDLVEAIEIARDLIAGKPAPPRCGSFQIYGGLGKEQ